MEGFVAETSLVLGREGRGQNCHEEAEGKDGEAETLHLWYLLFLEKIDLKKSG